MRRLIPCLPRPNYLPRLAFSLPRFALSDASRRRSGDHASRIDEEPRVPVLAGSPRIELGTERKSLH